MSRKHEQATVGSFAMSYAMAFDNPTTYIDVGGNIIEIIWAYETDDH